MKIKYTVRKQCTVHWCGMLDNASNIVAHSNVFHPVHGLKSRLRLQDTRRLPILSVISGNSSDSGGSTNVSKEAREVIARHKGAV